MTDLSNRYYELSQLIFGSLEGTLDTAQASRLQSLISTQEWALKYYCEYITLYSDLKIPKDISVFSSSRESVLDPGLWERLQEDERNAPTIRNERDEQKPERNLVGEIKQEKAVQKISKTTFFTVIISVAALFFLILWAHFTPISPSEEVATLTDSLNARWADSGGMMEGGKRLATGYKASLRNGFAKLLFDNHASVVIEAPAEFQILTNDQINLHQGRLYATVPNKALGFTVTTQNSKIIDLGTEFGVEVGVDGSTELHVLQGKTTLVSGEKNKTGLLVTEGEAKKISGLAATISDISCNRKKFARDINPRNQVVWRGENLRLASIVAGGDGFQEIPPLIGINPANGKFVSSIIGENRASKKAYNLVPDSKFIDGVFVPDGGQGPIIISSGGHTFNCPDTKGLFTHEVAAFRGAIDKKNTTIPPVVFKGKRYENDSQSVVVLHSNIGITFDLQAIRESQSGLDLKSFKAWGGITEALRDSKDQPDVDFWILVDGQVKYERKMLKIEDGTISFDIPLGPRDRFLTLIVTDGFQTNGKEEFPYANDFFYLMEPELCVTISNK